MNRSVNSSLAMDSLTRRSEGRQGEGSVGVLVNVDEEHSVKRTEKQAGRQISLSSVTELRQAF